MFDRIVLFVVAWQCQTHPQWRPITSRTKVRWWLQRVNNICTQMQLKIWRINKNSMQYCLLDLCAVVMIASIISIMRCSAESAPMVMSVPQKSLSMEPTKPTMFRWPCFLASVSVILPEATGDGYWTCFTGYNNGTINISQSMMPSRTISIGWNAVHSTNFRWERKIFLSLTSCFDYISDFHQNTFWLNPYVSRHWQKPKLA